MLYYNFTIGWQSWDDGLLKTTLKSLVEIESNNLLQWHCYFGVFYSIKLQPTVTLVAAVELFWLQYLIFHSTNNHTVTLVAAVGFLGAIFDIPLNTTNCHFGGSGGNFGCHI